MLIPRYIKGTSMYGYFNQVCAVNGFSASVLFSSRKAPCRQSNSHTYIKPMLTHTYYTNLEKSLKKNIPGEILETIAANNRSEAGPFDIDDSDTAGFLMEPELKYCLECIKRGEHYVYQQMRHNSTCRRHRIKLRSGCPHCGEPLPEELIVENSNPFICPSCLMPLTQGLSRAPEYMYAIETRALEKNEHEREHVEYTVSRAIVFALGAKDNFSRKEDYLNFLGACIENTGLREADIQIVKPKRVARITTNVPGIVISMADKYAPMRLRTDMSQDEIIESACELENKFMPECSAAGAILRMIYERTPKRMNIKRADAVLSDIKRALKGKLLEDEDQIADQIFRYYMKKTLEVSTDMYRIAPERSIFELSQTYNIGSLSLGIAILEIKDRYDIYIFE